MKKKAGQYAQFLLVIAFVVFVATSYVVGFEPGQQMGTTFGTTALTFLGLLPCAFLLIALFDVWVKRETIEKHLGHRSGMGAYVWIMLLAGMTVGGLYLAFPVACSLARKGARLGVVFTYVNFAGICRIPMVAFEASIMGWKFTAARMAVSIPLVILTSELLGRSLERRGYRVNF